MKSIFTYEDYREYLRDHYAEKKAHNRSYSFRFFARKAGLNSPNYLKLVMDGERNLTLRNIRKFAKGLNLGDRETLYFENLVHHNQTDDPDEKEFFRKNLELARAQDDRVLLTRDQYDLLSNWHPLAIKELVLTSHFDPKPKRVAAALDYRITPQEAKEALDLLVRVGMIKIDSETGKVKVQSQSMQTPDVVTSNAVVEYHQKMIDLAENHSKLNLRTIAAFRA